MIRLILDIESSLSPGTLFERASQALRECKLTADWEIRGGEAFEFENAPPGIDDWAAISEEEAIREERHRGDAIAAMRKRIAAAHQEAEA